MVLDNSVVEGGEDTSYEIVHQLFREERRRAGMTPVENPWSVPSRCRKGRLVDLGGLDGTSSHCAMAHSETMAPGLNCEEDWSSETDFACCRVKLKIISRENVMLIGNLLNRRSPWGGCLWIAASKKVLCGPLFSILMDRALIAKCLSFVKLVSSNRALPDPTVSISKLSPVLFHVA